MINFITASENSPFLVAFGVMLGIGMLELFGVVFGMSVSGAVSDILPDLDADGIGDVDGADISQSFLSKTFGWFLSGRVPVLVLIVLLLFYFALWGFTLQWIMAAVTGALLPAGLAALIILYPSYLSLKRSAIGIAKVLPRDETSAISSKTFIGRVVTITGHKVSDSNPGEAKFRDEHGQTHYLMVAPDEAGAEFVQGEEVLLVRNEGSVFRAIKNQSRALV